MLTKLAHAGVMLAAAVAVLALASPATAASIRAKARPEAGPTFAGEGLVWAAPRDAGGYAVAHALKGKVRTVAKFARETGEAETLVPKLAASGERVGLENGRLIRERGSDFPASTEFFTGPPGGTLFSLERCERTGGGVLRSIDVSGRVLVHSSCATGGARVHAPGAPEATFRVGPDRSMRMPRAAGIYLALVSVDETSPATRMDIVVIDRTTGAEVYRVPDAEIPGGVTALDLQEDGKVAFAYGSEPDPNSELLVGWASPADPHLHRLPLPLSAAYDLRIAQDQVAYQRPPQNPFGRTQIGLAAIGGASRVVVRGAEDHPHKENFDFDGTRLAWVRPGCSRFEIVTASATIRRSPKATTCRLRLARRPVRVGQRVRVDIDCSVFTSGPCERDVTLRSSGGTRLGSASRQRNSAVLVRLTKAGRQALARSAAVRISVVLRDEAGGIQRRVASSSVRR